MPERWVKCPRDGHAWPTKSTLIHATCSSCGYKLKIEDNLVDPAEMMEHFNLDENGVRILDKSITTVQSPRGTIIDVDFKQGKAWCEYDDSATCKHVEFALSLPVVQDIFKKKGWKTT